MDAGRIYEKGKDRRETYDYLSNYRYVNVDYYDYLSNYKYVNVDYKDRDVLIKIEEYLNGCRKAI